MKKRRIVISGMGVVSCFGTDVDRFYDLLLEGKSGVVMIREFYCDDLTTRFAAMIRDFDAGDYLPSKKLTRRADPFIRYSMVAGKKAIEMAQLDLSKIDKKRCGVIVGSGMGGMSTFYEGAEKLINNEPKRITPFFVPFIITNMGSALLAIDTGFQGPSYSISTACATSNYCILAAAQQIQQGIADLMLCGGVEAPMSRIGMAGFMASKVLSVRNEEPERASRPWDRSRDGFVMGEGAGVLVLESLDHALKRGAPIFAELLGGYQNCDAYHMTNPREDGAVVADCLRGALDDANIGEKEVNYINAHATGTIVGDMCEIRAIKSVFKKHISNLKVNATKSMIGHCLGAAGGIEAIATVNAIRRGMLHPTINLDDPEDELRGLDPVANIKQPWKVKVALSNSFGFGGHNSVIVLAPYV